MKKSTIFIYSLLVSVFMILLTSSIWLNNLEEIKTGNLRVTEWVIFIFINIITIFLVIKTIFWKEYKK